MGKLRDGDLVSVIVPAFNHERYVRHALDTVFDQDYAHIELILLDDGSLDGTFSAAVEWAERRGAPSRFRRVLMECNGENVGAHETINRGVSVAAGNAVAILNSDDAYAPGRLSALMARGAESGAELLFSAVRVIDDSGNRCLDSEFACRLEAAADEAERYPSLSLALLRWNLAVSTGNLLFSRSLHERVGGFRPLRYCHDWDFVLRACLWTEPELVPEPLYEYRAHGDNTFAKLRLEQHLEPQAIYRHLFCAAAAGNCANPEAPSFANWPDLLAALIRDDDALSGVYDLVSGASPRYDRIARLASSALDGNPSP